MLSPRLRLAGRSGAVLAVAIACARRRVRRVGRAEPRRLLGREARARAVGQGADRRAAESGGADQRHRRGRARRGRLRRAEAHGARARGGAQLRLQEGARPREQLRSAVGRVLHAGAVPDGDLPGPRPHRVQNGIHGHDARRVPGRPRASARERAALEVRLLHGPLGRRYARGRDVAHRVRHVHEQRLHAQRRAAPLGALPLEPGRRHALG